MSAETYRRKGLVTFVTLAMPLTLAACAGVRPFEGNDTGGIIAWTPETQQAQHDIASEHCERYRKIHKITSIHARYGDYIAFGCYWPRDVDPNRTITSAY